MFCMKSTKTKVCVSCSDILYINLIGRFLSVRLRFFFSSAGFEILAFPCNQFGGQEPGNNEEIQEVACTRLKAEFPIFDKVILTIQLRN